MKLPFSVSLLALARGASSADTLTLDASAAKSFGHGTVPSDFASFSYEVPCARAMLTQGTAPRKSFVGLMQQLQAVNGKAGPNIRVGGNSADESAWAPGTGTLPDNATYRITQADFEAYVAAVPLWKGTVTPGLNFRGGADATLEIAHATALAAAIPWSSGLVESVEVGNEPDLYPRNGDRPPTWGGADYAREAGAVMDALRKDAGVPANRVQGGTLYVIARNNS